VVPGVSVWAACRHWRLSLVRDFEQTPGPKAEKGKGAQPRQSGRQRTPPRSAAGIMAAQREKSAAVAAPAPGAAASGSPSPSSSSGAPAAAAGERWSAAIGNLGELGANVDALQKLLARKAVFVDDDIFSKASLAADQARTIKVYGVLPNPCRAYSPRSLEMQKPEGEKARGWSLSWV
jgi:hypothetical protein